MNAFAAASAVAALLTAPPRVAPRVEAFAPAVGVNSGYALTHRECATDAPPTRTPAGGFPYTGDVPRGLRDSPLFDKREAVGVGAAGCPDGCSIYSPSLWHSLYRYLPDPDGAVPTLEVTRVLRTWDLPAEHRDRAADYYRCGLHAFDRWYMGGLSDGRPERFPGAMFEIEGFTLRSLRLSGDPAERAALARECAASEFPLVRDLGRSLCPPAAPPVAAAVRFPFAAGVTPEELNSPFPEMRLILFGPRPVRDSRPLIDPHHGPGVGEFFWNPPARHDFRAADLLAAAGPTGLLTAPVVADEAERSRPTVRAMSADHFAELRRAMRAHARRLGVLFDDPFLLSAPDFQSTADDAAAWRKRAVK